MVLKLPVVSSIEMKDFPLFSLRLFVRNKMLTNVRFLEVVFSSHVGYSQKSPIHLVLVKLNLCVRVGVPAANHNVTAAPCLYKAAVFGIQDENICRGAACRLFS